MRKPIQIGSKKYKTKKEALLHYKNILNSYKLGEQLDENDTKDIYELLKRSKNFEKYKKAGIKAVQIIEIRYKTRVFQIIRDDNSKKTFSYISKINSPKTNFTKFSAACRNIINDDLRIIKQEYFDKFSKNGKVKCQESGELCFWVELVIDHRQPNTFSIIVDRFIEVNTININNIKYVQLAKGGQIFEDKNLITKFKNYHKEKANLRIVKKTLNLSRSYQARIKTQKKDLKIK